MNVIFPCFFCSLFGLKREEVVGTWRRLHSEELRNFYAAANVIRVTKSRRKIRAAHLASNAYNILVGKTERKRSLGRS
jgi:hypothetical protein